jgi:hypothetical protein
MALLWSTLVVNALIRLALPHVLAGGRNWDPSPVRSLRLAGQVI